MNHESTESGKQAGGLLPDGEKLRTDSVPEAGEGSYEGARLYAEGIEDYLADADVMQDAADAAPVSDAEADILKRAESTAAARSRAPGK